MNVNSSLVGPAASLYGPASTGAKADQATLAARQLTEQPETDELKERFQEFVGQTLFGSMMASMRKSVGKPAYLHGGQTEEIFQSQMDQYIVEDLSKASADTIAGPMYDLFTMGRSQ